MMRTRAVETASMRATLISYLPIGLPRGAANVATHVPTGARCAPDSEIGGHQLVGAPVTAPEYLHGGCANQVAVQIERFEDPGFITPQVGMNVFQRVFVHEKRRLHRAVVSPKSDGAASHIVEAASVGEIKHHASREEQPVRLSRIGSACTSSADRGRGLEQAFGARASPDGIGRV